MPGDFTVSVDAEGVAIIVLDAPARSMNVITAVLVREFADAIEQLISDNSVKGVLVTSGKKTFVPGYDLTEIFAQLERDRSATDAYANKLPLSVLYRRIETSGKPFAAAINGLALGGGLELALACHHRVLANDPAALVGLPEVKSGLLPGAGGTQRLPRLIGLAKALPILVEGRSVAPGEALKFGIVHQLAPREDVVARARSWLLDKPASQQPWDQKGFRIPGGSSLSVSAVAQHLTLSAGLVASSTMHNYPAPAAILSAAYEGAQLPIDRGLEIEQKYFAHLLTTPVARNLIRTMPINKGKADRLEVRPANVPYKNRCLEAYTAEGQRMLEEGIVPALIENAGRHAGMSIGPLAAADEASLELQYNAIRRARADLGAEYPEPIHWAVVRHFVEDLDRLGHKHGAGFYDYPQTGGRHLWPGLSQQYRPTESQPAVEEVKKRLLYIQSLEAARCFDEHVVTSAAEADLGSILGWGFPAWTGGTLSFIDTLGIRAFVSECERLAEAYGRRFLPFKSLLARSAAGQAFHPSG